MPTFFAGRLKGLRESAKLTQAELAQRCGVKQNTVARWEMGLREPPYKLIEILAQSLGVTVDKLFPAFAGSGEKSTLALSPVEKLP